MIHRTTRRHAIGVTLRHGLKIAAAVERRKSVCLAKGIKCIGKCRRCPAHKYRERNQNMMAAHVVASTR
jgi:hypothetical protein